MDTSNKTELAAVYKDACELNDFETAYTPVVATQMLWSVEKFKVAELMAFSGKTKKKIAQELGLPLGVLNKWAENPQFMEEVYRMSQDAFKLNKQSRQLYLAKVLAARIEQAEIEGYADSSRKDTVEIVAELRKEENPESSSQTNYTNLLENLLKHSVASVHKVVEIGESNG